MDQSNSRELAAAAAPRKSLHRRRERYRATSVLPRLHSGLIGDALSSSRCISTKISRFLYGRWLRQFTIISFSPEFTRTTLPLRVQAAPAFAGVFCPSSARGARFPIRKRHREPRRRARPRAPGPRARAPQGSTCAFSPSLDASSCSSFSRFFLRGDAGEIAKHSARACALRAGELLRVSGLHRFARSSQALGRRRPGTPRKSRRAVARRLPRGPSRRDRSRTILSAGRDARRRSEPSLSCLIASSNAVG